jgi:alpha-methylacyl-CoA racemase
MSNKSSLRPVASGPLRNLRVVEFAAIGPAPFAAVFDMGSDVVTIARPGEGQRDARAFVHRGQQVVETRQGLLMTLRC